VVRFRLEWVEVLPCEVLSNGSAFWVVLRFLLFSRRHDNEGDAGRTALLRLNAEVAGAGDRAGRADDKSPSRKGQQVVKGDLLAQIVDLIPHM